MIKASKNQFDMDNGWQNFLSGLRRGKGHLGAFLWNRIQWNYFYRFNIVPKFPLNLDIEASSKCNIKCEHCFRQYMDMREDINMSMDLYRKIVDECALYKLYTLKFSMRGEPLMNPEIVEMVNYAKKKEIKEVWINTNGGLFTEKIAEGLIKAKLDCLTVSFDGLGEIYETIRTPLRYKDSLAKLKMFMNVRKKLRAVKPIVKVQTLWSAIEKNPDEYLEIMSDIVDKVSYNIDFNFKKINLVSDPEYICYRLWQRIAVTSTGDVLKCPSDFEKEEVLGNVSNQSIKELWDIKQGEERKSHLARKRLESKVCAKCHHGAKPVEDITHVFADGKHKVVGVEFKEEFKGYGVKNK